MIIKQIKNRYGMFILNCLNKINHPRGTENVEYFLVLSASLCLCGEFFFVSSTDLKRLLEEIEIYVGFDHMDRFFDFGCIFGADFSCVGVDHFESDER